MSATLQMVPYDSWVPESIALSKIEELPWSDQKTRDKAIGLARGLVNARELGLPSQVNLYFANLKRLAKKSVSESIRQAIEGTGIVLERTGSETLEKVEECNSLIPPDMLSVMGLIQKMIPIAQFRVGTTWRQRDPYLVVGIPGGAWYRVGSWYRPDQGHILMDVSKVDLERLLGT